MYEVLCYTKTRNEKIAILKTPVIPRVGERIDIDTPDLTGIFRTNGRIEDVEYRFDKDGDLKHILILID